MPSYEVQHAYRSTRDGQQFGPWDAGDVIELTEEDGDWVNRDSPGCLKANPDRAAKKTDDQDDESGGREKPAGANRQHRGGTNR
jgi:hypothetical protein